MPWEKLGRLYVPDGNHDVFRSHAASPVPILRSNDRVRVFVSCRDEHNRAHIRWIDVSLPDMLLVGEAEAPVAALGELGSFDEFGMVGACATCVDGTLRLYYSGWQLGVAGMFWFYTGLLQSRDAGATFERVSPSPILDRDAVDPYLAGAPSVMYDDGCWRMWYTSGVRWERTAGGLRHYYHIKYADSLDGVHWRRDGRIAIDFAGDEYAIGRPWVVRDPDCYRMWFSVRGDAYRIGYAESVDGRSWVRSDAAASLTVSPSGWDADMVCYASVIDAAGERWMFYNGNGYGRSGVGIARWRAA